MVVLDSGYKSCHSVFYHQTPLFKICKVSRTAACKSLICDSLKHACKSLICNSLKHPFVIRVTVDLLLIAELKITGINKIGLLEMENELDLECNNFTLI